MNEVLPCNGVPPDEICQKLRVYTQNLAHHNSTAAAVASHVETVIPNTDVRKLREIPFNSTRKWGAVVLPEETLILGAPERILNGHDEGIAQQAQSLAEQGLRVLTFAPRRPAAG